MNWMKLLPLLVLIMEKITPQLREELGKCLDKLQEKAKETDSPVDDLVVKAFRALLNM